jgi:hypothetical protein
MCWECATLPLNVANAHYVTSRAAASTPHSDCLQRVKSHTAGMTVQLWPSIFGERHWILYERTGLVCGPGSSVGIATELRAGRSGIESRWERDFPPIQTDPGTHPASCKIGTGSFPGVKCGRGVLLTTHPLLVSRSWKSRGIPLPTLWATSGL